MTRIALTLVLLLSMFAVVARSQEATLAAGPMLGFVDQREAKIWVQTTESAAVHIEYVNVLGNQKKHSTESVTTERSTAFTATLVCDSAEPDGIYEYTVFINNKPLSFPYSTTFTTPPNWRWSGKDLPISSIQFGSCLYINQSGYERYRNGEESGYGSEFEILGTMAQSSADLMIWLGDNVYLREPDWNTRSGILKRYSHTRSYPGLQPFLASMMHVATWDDHDYGPNNSNRSFSGKDHTLEAHKLFWPNPGYGTSEMQGVMTTFEFYDTQIILLDDRWYRTPQGRSDITPEILGAQQTEWLIDVLASSTSTFKIVCTGSQFLGTDARKEGFSHAPAERDRILKAIAENNISGVMFLSGDVHGAELMKFDLEGAYPIYEFTSSSITAGSNKNIAKQPSENRVDGTAYGEKNFGMITLTGTSRKDRAVVLSLHGKDGKTIWERTVRADEIR